MSDGAAEQAERDNEATGQPHGPYRPRLDYGDVAGVKVVGGRNGALDTGGSSGP